LDETSLPVVRKAFVKANRSPGDVEVRFNTDCSSSMEYGLQLPLAAPTAFSAVYGYGMEELPMDDTLVVLLDEEERVEVEGSPTGAPPAAAWGGIGESVEMLMGTKRKDIKKYPVTRHPMRATRVGGQGVKGSTVGGQAGAWRRNIKAAKTGQINKESEVTAIEPLAIMPTGN
jgi:hypothetical protein